MKILRGRIIGLIPAALLQAALYALLWAVLKPYVSYIYTLLTIAGVFCVAWISYKQEESAYKLSWLLLILTLPVLGIVFYLLYADNRAGKLLKDQIDASRSELEGAFPESGAIESMKIRPEDRRSAETLSYIAKMSGMRAAKCSGAKYYPLGEEMFADLLQDLERAEKSIWIEYFIIGAGIFWNSIEEILIRKAEAGLDVRVMYDDLGCFGTFSEKMADNLQRKGISCVCFNPLTYITPRVNNRDHRKMTVIDGSVAYSGGINIADEYINAKKKYGHWKDIGFRLSGDAAIGYVYAFMELWNAVSKEKKLPRELLPDVQTDQGTDGYVLTYYDSPVHENRISNTLMIEILSQATGYVWVYTPYLMLGQSLMEAFESAARRGVDVRMIMPGIPDQKIIHRLSRSYYSPLLKAGVRIFEYTPGFLHAKAVISDGRIASVGTVNLDFRSLFLHFECSSVFYRSSVIDELEKDFLETQERSAERKIGDGGPGLKYSLVDGLLRLAAPLC